MITRQCDICKVEEDDLCVIIDVSKYVPIGDRFDICSECILDIIHESNFPKNKTLLESLFCTILNNHGDEQKQNVLSIINNKLSSKSGDLNSEHIHKIQNLINRYNKKVN